ncbi:hypothetical protein HTZ77_27105 [Nonomuraea sp. SMC257]|uniref:Uncharacterized protein n=1 Tax=Nonomuraea montanisoli TaxID=2741721 RepID=A0A7Y6M5W9_9ACTN|nr:hypothetical protein [Nonomuraea montanisoli]NUW35071.1 hypothetical protein [Nonomuraea montanisoli]
MSELERRYRRLLRLYPRDHRARHEEEMLGVLMETAEPGRRRPHPRDVTDLLIGAAALRLRRPISRQSLLWWRDAARVAAALGPLALIALRLPGVIHQIELHVGTGPAMPLGPGRLIEQLLGLSLSIATWVLAWRGRRWTAAVLAWAWTIWLCADMIIPGSGHWSFSETLPVVLALLPYLTVAVLLTGTAHPQRGVRLVGGRRILSWYAVALVATTAMRVRLAVDVSWLALEVVALGLTAIICGMAARSPLGRRSVALLTPVLLPVVLMFVLPWVLWSASHDDMIQAIVMVGAALAAFVITAWVTGQRKAATAPPREAAHP